jgi:hypothetical protein
VERDITIAVHLIEDATETHVRLVLDLRGDHFEAIGRARRNPIDPPLPAIGEELAIARALSNLEEAIMETALDKVEKFTVHV